MTDPLQRQVLAAIDLGSNSFHMVVASYDDGQLQVVDRSREMVRLAAGLSQTGKISRTVANRALDCIRRFGQHLREEHAVTVRAVGTNALRKAKNASDFLIAAEKALGYPIEVISGQEEARLVYLGAAHSLPDVAGQRLVVDIGGGSTELIVGSDLHTRELDSLGIGCVGLTEEYFPGGKISEKRWRRARQAADEQLDTVRSSLREKGWDEVIGTSGTIRSARRVLLKLGWTDCDIHLSALNKLSRKMITLGHVEKLDLNGLSQERAPVFPGGLVILQSVLDELEIDRMQVSRGALREGLMYDMLDIPAPLTQITQ
ncbi:MAG: exopolyphosphatase [Gammaproteobacteria bacterium]|nr:exopolyphosphatase [Gammaproteobacteria bacterium]MDH3767377.1 exopolyphosphatase [Gammaproteobacteria bacterium]